MSWMGHCTDIALTVAVATEQLVQLRRKDRIKAVRAVRGAHRYTIIRRFSLAITVVILYAVPLSGMARVDLVRGHHLAQMEPTWILPAIAAMTIVAACFWAATLALNAVMGRVFCGFGCLVAEVARQGDQVEAARGGHRARAWLENLVVTLVFSAGITLWWVDATVLWEGTLLQVAQAGSVFALVTLAALAHGRYWRWGFCLGYCPIGIYYSVVGRGKRRFGVQFDAAKCNDCNLCDKVCPAELEPRNLHASVPGRPGLSFGFPEGRAHCFVCGDCVRACELSLKKKDYAEAALILARPRKNRA